MTSFAQALKRLWARATVKVAGDAWEDALMARLVYIREIDDRIFLYFTTQGESFCLRDYSRSAHAPPSEVLRQKPGGHSATSIRKLAYGPGNLFLDPPAGAPDWKDFQFWHNHVLDLNKQHLKPSVGPNEQVGTGPEGKPSFTVSVMTAG